MELNKMTADTAYNCNKENHVSQKDALPEPKDNREVKVFSLNRNSDKTNSKLSSKETKSRSDSLNKSEAKKNDDTLASLKDEQEDSDNNLFSCDVIANLNMSGLKPASLEDGIQATSSVAVSSIDLAWVEDIIASVVESMLIGEIDGQKMVEITLSDKADVPFIFSKSNLSIVQDGNEISISFSNFMDEVQAMDANQLVTSNPMQLQGLITSLKDKNLTLTSMKIGAQVVQLPTLEESQTPLHMIAAAIRHQDEEQDQEQGDQRHSRDQQDRENLKVEEANL